MEEREREAERTREERKRTGQTEMERERESEREFSKNELQPMLAVLHCLSQILRERNYKINSPRDKNIQIM